MKKKSKGVPAELLYLRHLLLGFKTIQDDLTDIKKQLATLKEVITDENPRKFDTDGN